jgi:uncharacterized protein YegL
MSEEQAFPIVTRAGIKRPNWLTRHQHQRVVFARDASGSMTGTKAADASSASIALARELALPVNKDAFHLAIVDFASRAELVLPLEFATRVVERVPALSTSSKLGGATNVSSALEASHGVLVAATPPSEGISFLRPVVLLFSDGCHNEGTAPGDAATRLREHADVVTVAFGNDADEALLRSLASTPQHAYRCANGSELRSFLARVGETLAATRRAGTNATRALSEIE